MKKVIIAPDSFKGTLSSVEVCRIISAELKKRYTGVEVIEIPVADGGEGTVDAFLHCLGGEKICCKVKSPLGNDIIAYYGVLSDGTAVIEMAEASGISIENKNNAVEASSFGTGQLILNALDRGCRKILIGIGGSATTDGGVGAVAALGGSFFDAKGESIDLCGRGLSSLHKIDLAYLDKRIDECKITVLCDVKNPLYGKTGAAYIYAPQKGADEKDVELLDKGLRNLAKISEEILAKDYSLLEGTGAAGGLGFALVSFLKAELMPGIDCVLEVAGFKKNVRDADLVITGEGRMDRQSLMGKVPFGITRASKGKRVIAVVGVSDIDEESAKGQGISEIIETNPEHLPFETIKGFAEPMLKKAAEKIYL